MATANNATDVSPLVKPADHLEYDPLPAPRSIRVLVPHGIRHFSYWSTSLHRAELVEVPSFTLRSIALPRAPDSPEPYKALSYCWDEPSLRSVTFGFPGEPCVEWDGTLIEVKPNLYGALLRLSESPTLSALWADFLCINQQDVEERSQQVSQMAEVYAYAEQVVVWLGGSDVVETLWAGLERAGLERKRLERGGLERGGLLWEKTNINDDMLKWVGTPEDRAIQAGTECMEQCEWFRRAWTFQEVVAARNCIVRSGRLTIDWDALRSSWYKTVHFPKAERRSDVDFALGVVNVNKEPETRRLLGLLEAVWRRSASDPRDKVFSVLGLLQAVSSMRTDYRMSTRDVMVAASKACILRGQNLHVLWFAVASRLDRGKHRCWCRHSKNQLSRGGATAVERESCIACDCWVPGWVADWSSPHVAGVYPQNSWRADYSDVPLAPWEQHQPTVHWVGDRLVTRGIPLGRCTWPEGHDGSGFVDFEDFPRCAIALVGSVATSSATAAADKVGLNQLSVILHLHKQGVCTCRPEDAPDRIESFGYADAGGIEANDWICLLLGSARFAVLRPECHAPASAFLSRDEREMDDRVGYYEMCDHDAPGDHFALVAHPHPQWAGPGSHDPIEHFDALNNRVADFTII